jgi:hypothetical protein
MELRLHFEITSIRSTDFLFFFYSQRKRIERKESILVMMCRVVMK